MYNTLLRLFVPTTSDADANAAQTSSFPTSGTISLCAASRRSSMPSGASRQATARVQRVVSGVGAQMVLEIDVESLASRPPLRFALRRRWRDLLQLEAALVKEGVRTPLMLSTGRSQSSEQRRAAADGFISKLLESSPPRRLLEFLELSTGALLPPEPRVRLFDRGNPPSASSSDDQAEATGSRPPLDEAAQRRAARLRTERERREGAIAEAADSRRLVAETRAAREALAAARRGDAVRDEQRSTGRSTGRVTDAAARRPPTSAVADEPPAAVVERAARQAASAARDDDDDDDSDDNNNAPPRGLGRVKLKAPHSPPARVASTARSSTSSARVAQATANGDGRDNEDDDEDDYEDDDEAATILYAAHASPASVRLARGASARGASVTRHAAASAARTATVERQRAGAQRLSPPSDRIQARGREHSRVARTIEVDLLEELDDERSARDDRERPRGSSARSGQTEAEEEAVDEAVAAAEAAAAAALAEAKRMETEARLAAEAALAAAAEAAALTSAGRVDLEAEAAFSAWQAPTPPPPAPPPPPPAADARAAPPAVDVPAIAVNMRASTTELIREARAAAAEVRAAAAERVSEERRLAEDAAAAEEEAEVAATEARAQAQVARARAQAEAEANAVREMQQAADARAAADAAAARAAAEAQAAEEARAVAKAKAKAEATAKAGAEARAAAEARAKAAAEARAAEDARAAAEETKARAAQARAAAEAAEAAEAAAAAEAEARVQAQAQAQAQAQVQVQPASGPGAGPGAVGARTPKRVVLAEYADTIHLVGANDDGGNGRHTSQPDEDSQESAADVAAAEAAAAAAAEAAAAAAAAETVRTLERGLSSRTLGYLLELGASGEPVSPDPKPPAGIFSASLADELRLLQASPEGVASFAAGVLGSLDDADADNLGDEFDEPVDRVLAHAAAAAFATAAGAPPPSPLDSGGSSISAPPFARRFSSGTLAHLTALVEAEQEDDDDDGTGALAPRFARSMTLDTELTDISEFPEMPERCGTDDDGEVEPPVAGETCDDGMPMEMVGALPSPAVGMAAGARADGMPRPPQISAGGSSSRTGSAAPSTAGSSPPKPELPTPDTSLNIPPDMRIHSLRVQRAISRNETTPVVPLGAGGAGTLAGPSPCTHPPMINFGSMPPAALVTPLTAHSEPPASSAPIEGRLGARFGDTPRHPPTPCSEGPAAHLAPGPRPQAMATPLMSSTSALTSTKPPPPTPLAASAALAPFPAPSLNAPAPAIAPPPPTPAAPEGLPGTAEEATRQRTLKGWTPPSGHWERVAAGGSSADDSPDEESPPSAVVATPMGVGGGGGPPALSIDIDLETLPTHVSPDKRYGDGAMFGASVWTGAEASGSGVRRSGGGGHLAEFHRAAVRQAVLTAAAMPNEAWQLEYALEVHGLIEERNRMLRQVATEQKKSKTLLMRLENHACTQIVHVMQHIDRFAISKLFARWLHFSRAPAPMASTGGASYPWHQPTPMAVPFPSLDDPHAHLTGTGDFVPLRPSHEEMGDERARGRRTSLVGSCGRNRPGISASAMSDDAPTARSFRRPADDANDKMTRRAAAIAMAAAVDEIVGERGEEPYKELLVRWCGHLNSRPSWVLEIELKKNPSFQAVYERYRSHGPVTLTPV